MLRKSLSTLLGLSLCSPILMASESHYPDILGRAFITSSSISQETLESFRLSEKAEPEAVKDLCKRLGDRFKDFAWESDPCGKLPWRATLSTVRKNPLLFMVFGTGTDSTLILSAVHPDELTPIPMGFRLAKHLHEHPELISRDQQVVIAPLVNPDGFLIPKNPTRTNARGVDTNRNFFTLDWYEKSLSWWKTLKMKKLSHFPGHFPNSEVETVFQVRLIDEFQPDKILSIHAPLGFIDYDGPGDQKPQAMTEAEKQAKYLAAAISKKSNNYRVVDYSFYPGSLGNFAGNERHIPTITLELATTDARKVNSYWDQFLPGLLQAISYPFKKTIEKMNNTQRFYSDFNERPHSKADKS
ncbi:MAG: M14 family zinc carboxypeptidase [Bdellovibrionota bacterium]